MHKKVKKPHILYVVMDDQGYGDVGYTYPEQADMRTPLLDKLASEGLLFVSTPFFLCVLFYKREQLAQSSVSNCYPIFLVLEDNNMSLYLKSNRLKTCLPQD